MTVKEVINKLGIEEENLNNKNVKEIVNKVCEIANILGEVDFAFAEDVQEKRVDSGKIIASVYDVVFWERGNGNEV